MTETLEVPESAESAQGLRAGVLGLFDSVIMGIAGVAPGYSIAASTAILFGAVLLGGAAALLGHNDISAKTSKQPYYSEHYC